MRYVLNGPLKNTKTRTKLTETPEITPTSIHTNKTTASRQKCNRTYISFETIASELIDIHYKLLSYDSKYRSNVTGNWCYFASYEL